MKLWVEDEVQVYSNVHHGAIQKADMEAWRQVREGRHARSTGCRRRICEKFQRVAVPIWFKWANKDKDAARIFKLSSRSWSRPASATSRPTCIKGQKLDL